MIPIGVWLRSSTSSYSPDPIGSILVTVYIADVTIHILFYLVDIIYPQLSHFVKTSSINPNDETFAGWQEAAWKDVDRAFGVLQKQVAVIDKSCGDVG